MQPVLHPDKPRRSAVTLLPKCFLILLFVLCPGLLRAAPWKFVVVADTHFNRYPAILTEIAGDAVSENAQLVLIAGDLVDGGSALTTAELEMQLTNWRDAMAPAYAAGVGVYPVRGNHVAANPGSAAAWNNVFSGPYALPGNGPPGETGLTYSFTRNNAFFVGLDEHVPGQLSRVNQTWLNQKLVGNVLPHVFVFGHEPAFKVFHTDCLGSFPDERNAFWASLAAARARVYFCGHDHFFDLARMDDGDGDTGDDLYQCIVGTGNEALYIDGKYDGVNSPYTPLGVFHDEQHSGYVLVEISGDGAGDLGVTITWKERTYDPGTSTYKYVATSDVLIYTAWPGGAAVDCQWTLY